jgi:hypothetical protein
MLIARFSHFDPDAAFPAIGAAADCGCDRSIGLALPTANHQLSRRCSPAWRRCSGSNVTLTSSRSALIIAFFRDVGSLAEPGPHLDDHDGIANAVAISAITTMVTSLVMGAALRRAS